MNYELAIESLLNTINTYEEACQFYELSLKNKNDLIEAYHANYMESQKLVALLTEKISVLMRCEPSLN